MDRFEQIYAVHRELHRARYPVSTARLRKTLGECSVATVRRVVDEMRTFLGAPVESTRQDGGGYWYAEDRRATYELPGLWFNASEIHALLTLSELLDRVQPGFLQAELAPLRQRIETLLTAKHAGRPNIARRIRILGIAMHPAAEHFNACADAVLRRRCLNLEYHSRSRDELTERRVSPQRLTHYRDNWYLDAWCHSARALRSFSVDRIRAAHVLGEPAREIPDAELDRHFATAYGIFAGEPKAVAVLRFTPERARWVAEESWHPQQEGKWLEDGRYQLRIPYGNATELVMDILKYGPDVEVLAPPALRREVADRLKAACGQYQTD
jgi:proteasome accessory factor C